MPAGSGARWPPLAADCLAGVSPAVACVLAALGSVSDRMEKGLSQQSLEFMAGDRALQSSPAGSAGLDCRRRVKKG